MAGTKEKLAFATKNTENINHHKTTARLENDTFLTLKASKEK